MQNRHVVITCPNCGVEKTEAMPANACQFFYQCSGCGSVLKPKPGDCCVFCSYGNVACPPRQESQTGLPQAGLEAAP